MFGTQQRVSFRTQRMQNATIYTIKNTKMQPSSNIHTKDTKCNQQKQINKNATVRTIQNSRGKHLTRNTACTRQSFHTHNKCKKHTNKM